MQRQSSKPKKKYKKVALNSGKENSNYKKQPPTENRKQAQENGTQLRSSNNNRTRRNWRNRQRKLRNRQKKNRNRELSNIAKTNKKNDRFWSTNSSHFQSTEWAHASPRPYQSANQNLERNGQFCSASCTYNRFGQRQKQLHSGNRFHRFARADLPEKCTITDIKTGWLQNHYGT